MKRLLSILLAAMLLTTAVSAKDDSTPLVVQLLPDETDALPQNTIEIKLRSLTISPKADPAFATALQTLFARLAEVESYNYIYELRLTPQGGEVEIDINSLDRLTTADMKRRDYYGVLPVERSRFVVVATPENNKWLKSLFSSKGKHTIVQEYEMVEFKRNASATNVVARWNGNAMNIVTLFADGEEHIR